jgi:hypothetical protein
MYIMVTDIDNRKKANPEENPIGASRPQAQQSAFALRLDRGSFRSPRNRRCPRQRSAEESVRGRAFCSRRRHLRWRVAFENSFN